MGQQDTKETPANFYWTCPFRSMPFFFLNSDSRMFIDFGSGQHISVELERVQGELNSQEMRGLETILEREKLKELRV